MDLQSSLLVWAVSVVVVYVIAKQFGIKTFSAIVLALIVSQILLAYIHPINMMALLKPNESTMSSIYTGINIITPIIVLIYVIYKIFTDTNEPQKVVVVSQQPTGGTTARMATVQPVIST